ncbi:hypothetical protein D3C72_1977010 [compost metagenome]
MYALSGAEIVMGVYSPGCSVRAGAEPEEEDSDSSPWKNDAVTRGTSIFLPVSLRTIMTSCERPRVLNS